MAIYTKLTQTNLNINELRAWVGKPLYSTANNMVLNTPEPVEKMAEMQQVLDSRYKADGLNDWELEGGGAII